LVPHVEADILYMLSGYSGMVYYLQWLWSYQ